MPQNAIYALASLAVVYATYSLGCYVLKLPYWRGLLKGIAFANFFHCLITAGMLIYFFEKITLLGFVYFGIECIVLVFLSRFEYTLALKSE